MRRSSDLVSPNSQRRPASFARPSSPQGSPSSPKGAPKLQSAGSAVVSAVALSHRPGHKEATVITVKARAENDWQERSGHRHQIAGDVQSITAALRHELDDQQLRTFTRWWNSWLFQYNLVLEDLCTDIKSGVLPIKLVEALSESSCGKYASSPKHMVQMLENQVRGATFFIFFLLLQLRRAALVAPLLTYAACTCCASLPAARRIYFCASSRRRASSSSILAPRTFSPVIRSSSSA